MMIRVTLIRHGKTRGNLEGRYIGSTDEPLAPEGKAVLEQYKAGGLYPPCDRLYSSPLKRCLMTVAILYPRSQPRIKPGLAEYHFGIFEGKNYAELNGTPAYQAYIDSGGTAPIPGGEPLHVYMRRCADTFYDMMAEAAAHHVREVCVVCHGGAIMAILQHFLPRASMYEYRIKNGQGYRAVFDTARDSLSELKRLGE